MVNSMCRFAIPSASHRGAHWGIFGSALRSAPGGSLSEKHLIRLIFGNILWEQFCQSDQNALMHASLWSALFCGACVNPQAPDRENQPSKPLWERNGLDISRFKLFRSISFSGKSGCSGGFSGAPGKLRGAPHRKCSSCEHSLEHPSISLSTGAAPEHPDFPEHPLNFLWPKLARLGPLFDSKFPPETFNVGLVFAFFPRKWGT